MHSQTARKFKLFPGWPCAHLVHLHDRHRSLLNERVHLLSSGCVRAILPHAATRRFFIVNPCAPIACRFVVCAKPTCPSRHPILPVILMCLSRLCSQVSCQSTLDPGMGGDSASQSPNVHLATTQDQTIDIFHKCTTCHGTTPRPPA